MKTAGDIYREYRIMPSLARHQLRVAGVGTLVCEHFSGPVDSSAVILACLFHDMGNIIKSDLTIFPDFAEPEGYDYWKRVKDDYHAKYGDNEHHATIEIAHEIGLPEAVIELIDGIGFSKLEAARDGGAFEPKIVEHADLRVGPRGVLSLADRVEEARVRYTNRRNWDTPEHDDRYRELVRAAEAIQAQIFERSSIRPEDISDASVEPLLEELRKYPVA